MPHPGRCRLATRDSRNSAIRPVLVVPGVEDAPSPTIALQHLAVRAAADRVGRDEPGRGEAAATWRRPWRTNTSRDRPRGGPALPRAKQRVDIAVAEVVAQQLAAQERRVAHDHVRVGPLGPRAVRVQNRIPALDGVERAQDRVAAGVEAVGAHPLDLADPDRDAGELGGVGVELDAEHGLGPDCGEAAGQAERLGLEVGAVLDVLERAQREIEEVARAAGGVEHAERLEPFEEAGLQRQRPRCGRGWRRRGISPPSRG